MPDAPPDNEHKDSSNSSPKYQYTGMDLPTDAADEMDFVAEETLESMDEGTDPPKEGQQGLVSDAPPDHDSNIDEINKAVPESEDEESYQPFIPHRRKPRLSQIQDSESDEDVYGRNIDIEDHSFSDDIINEKINNEPAPLLTEKDLEELKPDDDLSKEEKDAAMEDYLLQLESANEERLKQRITEFDCAKDDGPGWLRCCDLFKWDFNRDSNDYMIPVKGLDRKLKPYQAYTVYRMLRIEKGIGHCFNACAMSMGKTFQCLVAHRLQHLINLMRDEIKNNAKQHRDPEQHVDIDCPT